MGFLQRGSEPHSKVKAQVIGDRYRNTMQTAVKENVAEGSSLMTDEFAAYRGNRRNPIHDGQRFKMILSSVAGQRLIYKELTGKTLADARQA